VGELDVAFEGYSSGYRLVRAGQVVDIVTALVAGGGALLVTTT